VERLYKETANPLFFVWWKLKYFWDNLDEELESGITKVTNKLTLSDVELEILDFITIKKRKKKEKKRKS